MDSIYLLIPIAIIFCIVAITAYLWAVDNGQYKDLDKEAHRILFDDEHDQANANTSKTNSDNDKS